jgi:hypothetical protein
MGIVSAEFTLLLFHSISGTTTDGKAASSSHRPTVSPGLEAVFGILSWLDLRFFVSNRTKGPKELSYSLEKPVCFHGRKLNDLRAHILPQQK